MCFIINNCDLFEFFSLYSELYNEPLTIKIELKMKMSFKLVDEDFLLS